jgi:hypothetical protein
MSTTPSPRNLRVAVSEDELRDLYLTQGLTIEQIATRFSLAPTTISRRFTDLGIRARRRGPLPGQRHGVPLKLDQEREWTAQLAYAVGLITTDGCLSQDGGHLTMTSKDYDLLETIRQCLGITARITLSTNPRLIYRLQWGDRVFHHWLNTIGLMPAKSLRLGPIQVPDEWMRDFLRGCIDGDGSIVTYTDRYNVYKKPAYVYERLFVSVVSASPRFLEWLRASVRDILGLTGSLTVRHTASANDLWCLRYAKRESLALLRWIYHGPDVPCLRRKRKIADPFLAPRERPVRRGPGRPMVV